MVLRRMFLLLCATVLIGRLAAQVNPCMASYLTTDDVAGTYLTAAVLAAGTFPGTQCTGLKDTTTCRGGPNARCTFSLSTFTYRCCHDVWDATDLATFNNGGANAGSSKPLCPLGSMSFGGGLQTLRCNITNTANAGCPFNYTCTVAANLPLATDLVTTNNARRNPNVCCLTKTLPGRIDITFQQVGLTPNIVPIAPKGTVAAITFTTPIVSQGDNMFPQQTLFTTANIPIGPFTITGVTVTAAEITGGATPASYHILIFDATTNRHILGFFHNGAFDAVTTAGRTIISTAPETVLSVAPTAAANQVYAAAYVGPAAFVPPFTSKHLIGVLFFKTSAVIATSAPLILTGAVAGGTFQPTTAVPRGAFTTVSAFLNSAAGKQLGTPVAGTYFYV
uniref:Uncharacterized protein n=1 Tax=Plectus sambesii TaxID=2011161 RepID=A0A914X9D1_9BILA